MSEMTAGLIAPCGMNCRLCYAYIRIKNPCHGCRGDDTNKPYHCAVCSIKTCEVLQTGQSGYCFDCARTCRRLQQLDKRYREKYHMSMLENLAYIRDSGLPAFLEREEARWKCPACGGVVSVHKPACPGCGTIWTGSGSV